jgi:hypothetical protein
MQGKLDQMQGSGRIPAPKNPLYLNSMHHFFPAQAAGKDFELSSEAQGETLVRRAKPRLCSKFPDLWENTGNFAPSGPQMLMAITKTRCGLKGLYGEFPTRWNREFFVPNRE